MPLHQRVEKSTGCDWELLSIFVDGRLLDESLGESFGVERVDGVVDGLAVGEVDAAFDEGGGDVFGGPQAVWLSNAVRNWGR